MKEPASTTQKKEKCLQNKLEYHSHNYQQSSEFIGIICQHLIFFDHPHLRASKKNSNFKKRSHPLLQHPRSRAKQHPPSTRAPAQQGGTNHKSQLFKHSKVKKKIHIQISTHWNFGIFLVSHATHFFLFSNIHIKSRKTQ